MKILVVEDNATLRRMIGRLLQSQGYEVLEADDGEEAWELLERDPVQFVLTDWVMPNLDGEQLIRRIRATNVRPYVYVIMLTAKGLPQDIVQGLEAGADDYLVKPFNLRELQARVEIGARVLRVEQELREARDRLEILATRDALTGLLNRKAITERAEAELNRASRKQHPLSLVMLDIDHFRGVNDQHGHLIGDQALRLVADAVRSSVRSYDYVGRWGGEEFLIVLPHATLAQAHKLAERMRSRIADVSLLLENGTWQTLSGSLGVVEAAPGEPVLLDTLLQRVDGALRLAKLQGRDRVQAFPPLDRDA